MMHLIRCKLEFEVAGILEHGSCKSKYRHLAFTASGQKQHQNAASRTSFCLFYCSSVGLEQTSQGLQASSFSGHFLWHHEASFCLIFVHFMRHHHRPSGPLSRLPFKEAYFSFVSIVSAGTQLLTRGHLVGFTHSASFWSDGVVSFMNVSHTRIR